MLKYKDVIQIKQQMELSGICDKDCFAIANKQKLNNFWQRTLTIYEYGVLWLKDGRMFFCPAKKAYSLISKGSIDLKQVIEIKQEEIESIEASEVSSLKAAFSVLVYWINIKYKNNTKERYGFDAQFENQAKFLLNKFMD